jgi:hypothetical protein
MASKKSPGLPPSFDIDIPRRDEGPVKLGDYLDEVEAAPPAPRAVPQKRDDESKVIEMPRPASPAPDVPGDQAAKEPSTTVEEQAPKKRRRKRKGPVRKQINATPEALKMIEELIDHVQTYSVQKDAKASEVFHALVLALYEAREFIELGDVPARGRWGTPTAKSFPISLKNAFQEAIAAAYKKHRR